MIAFTKELKIDGIDGVTAYRDSDSVSVFYLIASAPTFRIGPDGSPVFQFLKYREPVDRPNGKKGGGFLICDVVVTIPAATVTQCKAKLQELVNSENPRLNPKPVVEIHEITYTKGSASVQLFDGGGANSAMVEHIYNPAGPSLYGDLILPITVEFTPEGATLAEQALQGKGPTLQVSYNLIAPVKMPNMKVHVWFHAEKFMSFSQKVDINDGWYSDHSYKETVRQQFISSECGNVDIDPGATSDPKVIGQITDWGFQTMEDSVKRAVVGDIPDVSSDARKVPDGVKHLDRNLSVDKIANIDRWLTEGVVIEVDLGPKGSLPGINTLTGKDGKALNWSDFAKDVDLNDPFFKQINVNVRANADFTNLPIFSIDGRISYDGDTIHESLPFSLSSPNDLVKFASYYENDKKSYTFNYKVNYRAQSQTFDSGVLTSKGDEPLTIDVGDTGVLLANVLAADINFDEVTQALVTVHYEDSSNNVDPIEWEVTLDKDHKAVALQKVIFAPRKASFKFKTKYDMKNGQTYLVDWKTNPADQINVGSPFGGRKTLSFRAFGDLQSDISNIFIDVKYVDDKNNYTQTNSLALNKAQPFVDWAFSVVDSNAGKVTYSATIQFQDGQMQSIAETEATKNTILVGRQRDDSEFLSVTVQPDLVDFSKVKLLKVVLHYVDAANSIDSTKEFVITKSTSTAPAWSLRLQDRTKKSYDYTFSFVTVDGKHVTQGPTTTNEPILLPELAAAAGTGA
ncbi:MAG TPA: hypothetical protein VKZ53_00475 [Candidatus Angelobacter sp.]|nr:hypothetical protein [Candidatus Angelobacter sp.]